MIAAGGLVNVQAMGDGHGAFGVAPDPDAGLA
jgi:hypothetical protein